jgi:DNA-binding Lrp family transcriptional regulator
MLKGLLGLLNMKKLLTKTDIDIVEALSRIGPRNLRKVAKLLGIPRETLVFRMKRMASDSRIFLRCFANIYHTNLGLKKAVVFADAVPSKEELLFECLKANGFWLFVGRSYRGREGCNAVYAVPIDHCAEFEEFIHELERLRVARDVQIFWSTCFQGGRITGKWFDREREEWVFPWDDWVREVQDAPTALPYTLIEPEAFVNHADEIDIFILKELEKDASISLSKIAAELGISSQWAGKHFRNKIMGRGLIEGYQIFILPFNVPYDVFVFVISFYNYETMARFANSLLDKPFIVMVGKLFGQNALITETCLPRIEFRSFVDALSLLGEMKIISDYQYLIQDLRRTSRQTISYEFFKENKWIYDHQQHLTTLEALVNKQTYSAEKQ